MIGVLKILSLVIILYGVCKFIAYAVQKAKEDFEEDEAAKQEQKYSSYKAKIRFFTPSELTFFEILNAHIDAHRHTIFPKVRLGDLVEVDHGTGNGYGHWARIRSRHIDYIVWDLVEKRVVVAIELDGASHNGKKAKESDVFKDGLFESVGIELARVRVGEDFESFARQLAERINKR